ncbi:MAG: hypothetical protein JSR21_10425 [Proteobacteria bacterium]|nr:hypothetical protein [Pseudomonadota bacterium]
MRQAWIGSVALAALVAASCAPATPPAGTSAAAGPPAVAGSGTVLVVRRVAAVAGADAAWRERLLREAVAVPDVATDAAPDTAPAPDKAPDMAFGAGPLAEIIVRMDAGGLISVVQPATTAFAPGQRVAIGGASGAASLSRL